MLPALPWNHTRTGAPAFGTHQPWSLTPSAASKKTSSYSKPEIRRGADEIRVGEEDDALFGIFQDHGGPVGGKPDISDFKIENKD